MGRGEVVRFEDFVLQVRVTKKEVEQLKLLYDGELHESDYKRKIKKRIDNFEKTKGEIFSLICRLQNSGQRTVLTEYYLNCETIEKIAERLNYSVSQIKRHKKRGEMSLKNIYQKSNGKIK